MAKWASEAKVGLFITVAVLIFVFGVLFLQDYRFEGRGYRLKVLFASVTGLTNGDPVEVAGLKVGAVKGMALSDGRVEVQLWVDRQVKLPKDSQFTIRSVGALGDKVVSIRPGEASQLLGNGDSVSGTIELDVADLLEMIAPLNEQFRSVLANLTDMVDKESQQQLKGSLSNVRAITNQLDASLRGNLQDLDVILGNLSQASDALRKLAGSQKQEDLTAITQDAKGAAASLKGASVKLDSSLALLQGVLAKADSGQGTVARLLNDRALYDHLDALVRHADELVGDWKKNPRKYVNLEVF